MRDNPYHTQVYTKDHQTTTTHKGGIKHIRSANPTKYQTASSECTPIDADISFPQMSQCSPSLACFPLFKQSEGNMSIEHIFVKNIKIRKRILYYDRRKIYPISTFESNLLIAQIVVLFPSCPRSLSSVTRPVLFGKATICP